ncbi:MAG: hypothetical protein AAF709_24145, partial [Pseudomonadota bacterium]
QRRGDRAIQAASAWQSRLMEPGRRPGPPAKFARISTRAIHQAGNGVVPEDNRLRSFPVASTDLRFQRQA